jgi:predicted secreted protein
MAVANVIFGTQLFIKIGDGASPEEFVHPCLINAARGIQFSSNNNSVVVPDCDNPEDPAWQKIVKDALSVGITGEGKLDVVEATLTAYTAWWKSTLPKNVQVWLSTTGYWEGAFHLTDWDVTGDRGDFATASITLASDGEISDFQTS